MCQECKNHNHEYNWRRVAFTIVVLAYLGFLAAIIVLMFLPGNPLSAMGHFSFVGTGETHDLIHELVFASIIGTAAVGLLTQLWKPKENFAGQLVALSVWVVMFLAAAFTNNWVPQPLFIAFGALTVIAILLHPAGRGLFNWFTAAEVNKKLLILVVVAAVPLLALVAKNLDLQGGGSSESSVESGVSFFGHQIPVDHGGTPASQLPDEVNKHDEEGEQKHINLGHYRNLAALSFIVILTGLLASFRPKGFRVATWVAGLLPILLGLASSILPDAESALSLVWSIGAIVWGIGFIAVAEFTKDSI